MSVLARVLGSSSVVLPRDGETVDPSAYLSSRKARRLMGLQDELAVVAVGRALAASGLSAPLGLRVGVYLAVGYIPFLEADLLPILEGSLEDGELSERRFGIDGSQRAHPFLTFRCLPNMPAFHVSASFGVEGPYVVAYPGAGQLGLVLEEAVAALAGDDVDVALVLGVTHQRNFLVEQHFAKQSPPVGSSSLCDAAACLVLGRDDARAAAKPALRELAVRYEPAAEAGEPCERGEMLWRDDAAEPLDELGPASLPDAVHRAFAAGARAARIESRARDGLVVASAWSGPQPNGASS